MCKLKIISLTTTAIAQAVSAGRFLTGTRHHAHGVEHQLIRRAPERNRGLCGPIHLHQQHFMPGIRRIGKREALKLRKQWRLKPFKKP
jgi:hypothetical protein